MREPCGRIAPFTSASMIASGVRARSVSSAGARESAAPVWHDTQRSAKTFAPSGDCARDRAGLLPRHPTTKTTARTTWLPANARITVADYSRKAYGSGSGL